MNDNTIDTARARLRRALKPFIRANSIEDEAIGALVNVLEEQLDIICEQERIIKRAEATMARSERTVECLIYAVERLAPSADTPF